MLILLALEPIHIIGIVIVALIIIGIIAYLIVEHIKNKRFIEEIERRKEERLKNAAEKELLTAQYRKNKEVEGDFLSAEAKEEALKNAKKKSISKYLKETASIEDCATLSDEIAESNVVIVKDEKVYTNRVQEIVITTTQLNAFEANEIVNPLTLIEKGIVPKYGHYHLKIQAKGPIKKPLNVEAHEYDMDAIKMILIAGGSVIKVI